MSSKLSSLLRCTACSWAAGEPVYYPREMFSSISGSGNHRNCPHSAAYRKQIPSRKNQKRTTNDEHVRYPEFDHPYVIRFLRGNFTKNLNDYTDYAL